MPLIVDEQVAQSNSRIGGVRLTMLTLRSMENWRLAFDDCDKTMILLAVSSIIGERFTRGEELEEQYRSLETTFPQSRLQHCNIMSIAAATGFNRETTRRKVNELIDEGVLVRSSRGAMRFAPGYVQDPHIMKIVISQLWVIARVTSELMREGVIRAV